MDSIGASAKQAKQLERLAKSTTSHHSDPHLQKVIQSFNTWAFKREQPCRPQLLARVVARAVEHRQPIEFVLYWGKGPRSHVAAPDLQCLDYLASLARRVRSVHAPGAAFKLVLTDTHAKLNGHSHDSVAAYFADVRREAGLRGFACHLLGELTAAAAPLTSAANDDAPVPGEALSLLAQSAARWYGGEGTALEGAARYYRLNMIEKRVMEKMFPNAIFVTFNGSEQRELFPSALPIFYMYSTKRGTAVKPWFQDANEMPAGAVPVAARMVPA